MKEQLKKEQMMLQSLYEKNAIIEQMLDRIEQLEKELNDLKPKEE